MENLRLKICYKCPLYSTKYDGLCNNNLWLNKETGEVSAEAKPGFVNGCGCILKDKVKKLSSICPTGKW